MLDRAFLGLVGAGATTLAPAFELDVPPGAVAGGARFIEWLYRANPADAHQIVQITTSEIWSSTKPAGLAADEISYHLLRLPDILERNQTQPGRAATTTTLLTEFARSGPTGVDASAREFAASHLGICCSNGTFGLSGLDETVTTTLLEALFRGLLRAAPIIAAHRPTLAAYLESHCWRKLTQPSLNETSPPSRNATISKALHERYGGRTGFDDLVDRACRLSDTFVIDLDRLGGRATGRYGKLIAKARRAALAGDPSSADQALAAAEDINIQAALIDIAGSRQHLASAAEVRILRGQLHEIIGDFLRAANHFALAARHVPRTDHAMRWQLTEHQARALSLAARFSNDPSSDAKAEQVRAEATEILPEWWRELQRGHQPPGSTETSVPLAPAVPLSDLLALIEGPSDNAVRVEPWPQ